MTVQDNKILKEDDGNGIKYFLLWFPRPRTPRSSSREGKGNYLFLGVFLKLNVKFVNKLKKVLKIRVGKGFSNCLICQTLTLAFTVPIEC